MSVHILPTTRTSATGLRCLAAVGGILRSLLMSWPPSYGRGRGSIMRRLDTAYLDRTTDWLAPWATKHSKAVSRLVAEPTGLPPSRTHFQRDRDRIIHARAFRRLAYKTQVYSTDESDHTRTRLTHTLEVFQIARGIVLLGLNEDLIEAISFAHDLGHTPFGHAGGKSVRQSIEKERRVGFCTICRGSEWLTFLRTSGM